MPDERVQAAIENWAPRFVSQGVDFNDFQRVTSAVERWPEWLPAWVANGDMHAALAREAEGLGRRWTAGEAWNRAALSYHFAKFVWMVDMDRYRDAAEKAVAAMRELHRLLDPAAERVAIPFESTTMLANLRRPPTAADAPLVLLLPGLDSTKEEFWEWENVFLRRGLATLSLDGPGQGETGYTTHIRPDYEVAVTAVLDHLGDREDLDLDRVAAVGVSLGGYYAPRAAAFEPRVRAAVAIGGPYDWGDCWNGLPQLSRETFVHHSGASDDEEGRKRAHELSLETVLPRLQ